MINESLNLKGWNGLLERSPERWGMSAKRLILEGISRPALTHELGDVQPPERMHSPGPAIE
ncbi:MAG: hypothetical protein JWO94_722 [Verrucomicrobiaceae bacterium]|nr:hypothetical protein [Verrucomicrobiaceae bacterium]